MKYIYYLLVLLFIISISVPIYLFLNNPSEKKDPNEVVMRVNGRNFTMKDLNDRPHDLSPLQYAKTIIDKELLIQEAMRLKIHEDPIFKKSIKSYYEQSLITALMNLKSQEYSIEPNDEEISRLLGRLNSIVELTLFMYEDYDSAKKGAPPISEKKSRIDFSDLSDSLKYHLSSLSPGEKTPPLIDQTGFKVVRLDKLDHIGSAIVNESLRTIAFKLINAEKIKFMMETWQQDLKNKSKIEIMAFK